jgi:hypothetical protein
MPPTNWPDATFNRFERSIRSSTDVAEVVLRVDDVNVEAYLKAIGNRAGTHVLACELIGSKIAEWFGLSTLDFGIMQIEENDEIPLGEYGLAKAGPAFVSKKEPGSSWPGDARTLDSLLNPEDIAKLVVFDTWILNADRFPPEGMAWKPNYDNVFLSDRDGIVGKHRIIAMDHTQCLAIGGKITSRIGTIGRVKDERLYGLFPEFERFLSAGLVKAAAKKLRSVSRTLIEEMIGSIPVEWGIPPDGRKVLQDLLFERAYFLADEVYDMVVPHCQMHDGELLLDGGKENGGK